MTTVDAERYEFEVNGRELSSPRQKLTVSEVLEIAKEGNALDGDVGDQVLEDLDGTRGEFRVTDEVDLGEDHAFVTVPNRPAPVA